MAKIKKLYIRKRIPQATGPDKEFWIRAGIAHCENDCKCGDIRVEIDAMPVRGDGTQELIITDKKER